MPSRLITWQNADHLGAFASALAAFVEPHAAAARRAGGAFFECCAINASARVSCAAHRTPRIDNGSGARSIVVGFGWRRTTLAHRP